MTKILAKDELAPYGSRFSDSHRARLEKAGKHPKRVRLSPHHYGYLESEMLDYLAQRVAERDGMRVEAA